MAPVGNGRETSFAWLCLHLWELGGVSGALGWCWVCTCSESSTCNCSSVQVILASEGGAKCSSESHVWLCAVLAICKCGCSSWHEQSQFSSTACAPASSRQAFLRCFHRTCWAVLQGNTGLGAGAGQPGSHGARDDLRNGGSPIWWGTEVQQGKGTLGCTLGIFQGAGWSGDLNSHHSVMEIQGYLPHRWQWKPTTARSRSCG